MSTVIWKYTKKCKVAGDACFLDVADLDHTRQVWKNWNIAPGSVDKVVIEFIVQREKLARFAIKQLDILLKIDGLFELHIVDSKNHGSYFLSRDQVKYEFAVSTNGRYGLIATEKKGEVLVLRYLKKAATLPQGDYIDRWTFGTITNGKKLDSLNRLIASIQCQQIPEYEIVICGPYPPEGQPIDYKNVRILPDVVLDNDIRFPIGAKKNRIIEEARYNNLCILHDRFHLPDNWYKKMDEYGNYFDYLCLPTLDESGNRFMVDWMTFSFPLTQKTQVNTSLPYHEWSEGLIIQGGVIVGKKHLIMQHKLDERLHWEELEDIHFSKQAYLAGSFFNIDVNNAFISESVNHTSADTSLLGRLKTLLYPRIQLVRDLIRFRKLAGK